MSYSTVLSAELLVLAAVFALASLRTKRFAPAAVSLIFALCWFSQSRFIGAAFYETSVLPPGSWVTRFWNMPVSPGVRRALEPALSALFAALLATACTSSSKSARASGIVSALLLVVAWGIEARVIAGSFLLSPMAQVAHRAATQGMILSTVALAGLLLLGGSAVLSSRARVGCAAATIGTVLILSVLALPPSPPRPLVAGAHYYSWFPENWSTGFLGEKLDPPVLPELGRYVSGRPEIFDAHAEWMRRAGINLVIFDWWPKNPAVRKKIDRQVEMLARRSDLQFAVHYEILDLKERTDPPVSGEPANVIYMSPERAARMARHFENLANHYFGDKNYFRIDGKPVLFIYATRHLVGPVAEAVAAARRLVREKTGMELFLVGDEIYFNVPDYDAKRGIHLLSPGEPSWERIAAFDAIGCYNPYDESRLEHAGTRGAPAFLSDVQQLFARYRRIASTAGVDFFPAALPGYNDRGVRPKENHFVVPRELDGRTMFERTLELWVAPFLDGGRNRLFTITSFNEWNEATQIEPTSVGPRTAADSSGSASYTVGESYRGYGEEYLELLSNFLKSHEKPIL